MPLSLSGNGTITGNVSFANSVTLSTVTATTVSANSINSSSYVSANSHVITGINYALGPQTMKNRIINGDMRIDQRFNGAGNNNIATWQHVVDRWGNAGSAAGKLRYQQNNTNGPTQAATVTATGFNTYFGANVVSSNTVNSGDYWTFLQAIEGLNIADLNWGTASASPVTVSFWSYSSVAGTHSGSLRNSNVDRSYPFSYTISTANTWQYQTLTIPGDTSGSWFSNTGVGVYLTFNLGTGSTFLATANGTWQSGNYVGPPNAVQIVSSANGSFYITGVQFEKGSQATSFDWRHYGTEFQLCQRYFQYYPNFYVPTGGNAYIGTLFQVPMRSSPSITGGGAGFATSITNNSTMFLPYQTSAAYVNLSLSAELVTQN